MLSLIAKLRARGALLHALCVGFGLGTLFMALALSVLGTDMLSSTALDDRALESTLLESTFAESTLSETALSESSPLSKASPPSFSESSSESSSSLNTLFLDLLLGFAFCSLFVALFIQIYGILRIKKQAKIKAYFKPNSLFHRYFGRFFITKIAAFFAALLGLVPLFFMLIFPSEGEILSFWLLLPCSFYGYKVALWLLGANISEDFAPLLAKKYTAFVCGILASFLCVNIGGIGAYSYDSLEQVLAAYHISSFGVLWQEIFGFVLVKHYLFVSFYESVRTLWWARFGLEFVYFCGLGVSFMSFCLLVLGCMGNEGRSEGRSEERIKTHILETRLESSPKPSLDSETHTPKATHSTAFTRFFATLFFLIFLGLACVASALCVKLLHTLRPESPSIATSSSSLYESFSLAFMRQNARYVQIVLDNTKHFVKESELGALENGLGRNIDDFHAMLDSGVDRVIDDFFAQSEVIVDEYAKWYFSIYGEYTRLFYAAVGKGEEIAQEQFVFLLKAHTPFDLHTRLEALYKNEILSLNARVKQSLELHSYTEAKGEVVDYELNLGDFLKEGEGLSLRLSDKISATLGLSLAGALVLKSGAKALGKSSAKLVGKSALKKGAASAISVAGGSITCGVFAPLCAVGLFVASDYALNSLDAALNEEAFKAEMRKGLGELRLQLKTSLYEYNSTLSNELSNALPLGKRHTKDTDEAH